MGLEQNPEQWTSGPSRVPYWIYSSQSVYERELERLFYKGHWCYVGLEAELPEPRRFKTTKIGERSVIVTRDRDGQIHEIGRAHV